MPNTLARRFFALVAFGALIPIFLLSQTAYRARAEIGIGSFSTITANTFISATLTITPTATVTPTAAITPNLYLPIVLKTPPPSATLSRYLNTISQTVLYNLGCSRGSANQNGVLVLDFGAPRFISPTYGSRLFNNGGIVSTSQIATATQAFMQGYWNCAPPTAHIEVAIGTTNCSNGTGPNACNPGGINVTREHGQAWAQMVRDVNAWITASGYDSKLLAAGANDIELSWSSPVEARAWVGGYFSLPISDTFALYNYGACDSCPFAQYPNLTMPNGWTQEDVWYVSFGASVAYPLPEIYLTSGVNADQWQRIGAYAFTKHGRSMNFAGAFTQWQACQDVGPGACNGTDNTPSAGWLQLYNALNADARTAQPLKYSTDITWQK